MPLTKAQEDHTPGGKAPDNAIRRPQTLIPDIVLIICLLLASIKITYSAPRIMDIALYDETSYLANGARLLTHGLPNAELAPGYAVWYALLHVAQPDNVTLYFLNFQILTALITVALYAALRRAGAIPTVSGAAAFLYLTSGLPLIWPRVSHFAVLEMLSCFLLASFTRSLPGRLAWAAFAMLLISFTRPEYATAFACCLAAGTVILARQARRGMLRGSEIARPAIALLAVTILLLAVFGSPIQPHSMRQYVAFAQHFTVNYVAWNHLKTNAWTSTETIMPMVFGKAHSVLAAFAANPGAMLRHAATNARHLPRGFAAAILGGLTHKAWVLECLGWLALLGHLAARRKAIAAASDPAVVKALGFLSLIVAVPTVISAIVLYPEPHYLLMQIVLALVLAGYWASLSMPPAWDRIPGALQAAALGIGFIIVAPPFSSAWYEHRPVSSLSSGPVMLQENLTTIRYLQGMHLKPGPVPILEQEGGYYVYLPDNYSRVTQYAKDEPFDQFIRDRKVEMIVVSPELRQDARFKDDPEFASFLRDPSVLGFKMRHIDGTNRDVYVASDRE